MLSISEYEISTVEHEEEIVGTIHAPLSQSQYGGKLQSVCRYQKVCMRVDDVILVATTGMEEVVRLQTVMMYICCTYEVKTFVQFTMKQCNVCTYNIIRTAAVTQNYALYNFRLKYSIHRTEVYTSDIDTGYTASLSSRYIIPSLPRNCVYFKKTLTVLKTAILKNCCDAKGNKMVPTMSLIL